MAKKTSNKKYRYSTSGSFITTIEGIEHKVSFNSQLYQIGVYIIWNGDSATQGGISPDGMQRLCRKLKKDAEAGKIKDLVLDREIVVAEVDGFWKDITVAEMETDVNQLRIEKQNSEIAEELTTLNNILSAHGAKYHVGVKKGKANLYKIHRMEIERLEEQEYIAGPIDPYLTIQCLQLIGKTLKLVYDL